jgi:acyl-CoA reductase-like NAD-dependent aldehyde dehydrogenase
MSNNTQKNELEKLYLERDTKFDDIVSCLGRELYGSAFPASEADLQRLIEEAEELTDKWAEAEAENRPLQLSTALQILLSEHQELCKRILEIVDSGELNNDE